MEIVPSGAFISEPRERTFRRPPASLVANIGNVTFAFRGIKSVRQVTVRSNVYRVTVKAENRKLWKQWKGWAGMPESRWLRQTEGVFQATLLGFCVLFNPRRHPRKKKREMGPSPDSVLRW